MLGIVGAGNGSGLTLKSLVHQVTGRRLHEWSQTAVLASEVSKSGMNEKSRGVLHFMPTDLRREISRNQGQTPGIRINKNNISTVASYFVGS